MKCKWCDRALDIIGEWVRPGLERSGYIYKCDSCDTEILASRNESAPEKP